MQAEHDHRSLKALRAYVTGDAAEPDVFSALRGIPRADVQRLLRENRQDLETIDPARAVILESLF